MKLKKMIKIFYILTFFLVSNLLLAQPSPPVLISPYSSQVIPLIGHTFDWSDVPTGTSYRIQISTSYFFTSTIVNEVTTSSQYTITTSVLDYGSMYWWRVNATNSTGTGEWSSIVFFYTIPAVPNPPFKVYPVNNSSICPRSAKFFKWRHSDGAINYGLQIIKNGILIWNVTGITDTFYIAPPDTITSTFGGYKWRLNATGYQGTSNWSPEDTFYLSYSPDSPTLSYPTNGAINIPVLPVMTWYNLQYVDVYILQISKSPSFDSLVYNDTTVLHQVQLQINTKYYWRVCGLYYTCIGSWSNVWSFTTSNQIGINLISSEVPSEYKLFNNYPNPFNSSTIIKYQIIKDNITTLKIFDVLGREVSILINSMQKAGTYNFYLNVNNLPSGIYYYQIESGNYSETKKMVLIK